MRLSVGVGIDFWRNRLFVIGFFWRVDSFEEGFHFNEYNRCMQNEIGIVYIKNDIGNYGVRKTKHVEKERRRIANNNNTNTIDGRNNRSGMSLLESIQIFVIFVSSVKNEM